MWLYTTVIGLAVMGALAEVCDVIGGCPNTRIKSMVAMYAIMGLFGLFAFLAAVALDKPALEGAFGFIAFAGSTVGVSIITSFKTGFLTGEGEAAAAIVLAWVGEVVVAAGLFGVWDALDGGSPAGAPAHKTTADADTASPA